MKALFLICVCFLVYFNGLHSQFVSDDYEGIVYSTHPSYEHLAAGTDAFLHSKFGNDPFPFHLTSAAIHSINTVLVFLILKTFFSPMASLIGASFFAVHPIHTEAVTWISGNPYLFYGLLFFLTLYLYKKGNFWYLLSLCIFSFFLPTHYSWYSLIAPLIFIYEVSLNRGRKNILLTLPYLFIAGAYLSTKILAFKERTALLQGVKLYDIPIANNPFVIVVHSIYSNFYNLFIPAKLSFYREPQIITPQKFALEIVVVFLLISTLSVLWRRAKPLFWGLATFLIGFLPTYSPLPICWLVCDRYSYVPSIFYSICIAWIYKKYSKFGNMVLIPIFLLFLILSFRTVARNEDYRDNRRFWGTEVLLSPLSPRSHNELGRVFVSENNMDAAINEFNTSLKLSPKYSVAWSNIAVAFQFKKDYDNAVKAYENAILYDPNMFMPNFLVGAIYLNSNMFDKAIERLEKAEKLQPDNEEVKKALGIARKLKNESEKGKP